ncbi:GntR family transcriptional regulator [Paraburkholderia hospita]|nr:GntR family transcriptional regulator [Paraburkholderia hospita]
METTLPLPKYHQIYLVLREQLQEGRFDDEGMPGEHLLAEQFSVARITIRKAMEMLVADGLVTRRPGVGTWPLRVDLGKKDRRGNLWVKSMDSGDVEETT